MSERRKQVDVAIVGGGPAGMVAACLLAREGLQTLVLEGKPDFDRHFRGEILQPRFQRAMHDVGLYDVASQIPHEEIDGAHIYFEGLRCGVVEAKGLDCQFSRIWWMTQPNLLDGLDTYARQYPCYEIWFDAKAVGLRPESTLEVRTPEQSVEVQAKVILGADGRFSALSRFGGFEHEYDHHDVDVVWFLLERPKGYKHFFSFFVGTKDAFLVLPKHPNQLQCGMVFRPGEFAHQKRRGIEAFRRKLGRSHPLFREFAKSLPDFSPFHLLKGNRALVRNWVRDGVLLIGDAAHTCSPAGGVGVAIAVETACVAADVVCKGFHAGDLSDAMLRRVQELREDEVRRVHQLQGRAGILFSPFWPVRFLIPPVVGFLSATKLLTPLARRLLAQQRPLG